MGGDEEWLAAELARENLAPGRAQQLTLRLNKVRRLRAQPLRQTDTPTGAGEPTASAETYGRSDRTG